MEMVDQNNSSQNNNIGSKNDSFHQDILNENNNIIQEYNNDTIKNFSFLHYIICFIINLILIIVTIYEFNFRKNNKYLITIFLYLTDFFVFFTFIFVLAYFCRKKLNYLKGVLYYPFCSFFWGTADFLSIYYINNGNDNIKHDWDNTDTLKLVKLLLIIFSLIINVFYFKFYRNDN